MALSKQVIDMQASDGLQQKIALQRLPPGKSARALNLVKNKMGRLEKRLGFQPLTNTDPFLSGFSFSTGINLGTWNQNPYAIGRGTWSNTGQVVTALSSYSDDLTGMVRRGAMPDVKVTFDNVVADTANFVQSPSTAIAGDVVVQVWIDAPVLSTGPQYGNVWWLAYEATTGDLIQPPAKLYTGHVTYLRLCVVNASRFVVCYQDLLVNNTIFAQTQTLAGIQTGLPWTASTAIITDQTDQSPSLRPFDMRAATGDTTDFVIAYQRDAGDGTAAGVIVQRRRAASPTTLDAQQTAIPGNLSIAVSAIALRADNGQGRVAVAACQPTDLTYPTPASAIKLLAAVLVYPSLAFENGSATNSTTIYTAATATEPPAVWLDLIYSGTSGLGGLAGRTWTIVHSPWGAVWNATAEPGGPRQGTVDRHVTSAPLASRCARIITNQFQDGVSALTPLTNTSGGNAGVTPGLILAGRGIEFNNIAYFLAWIPSQTQGSFLVLAYDQNANPGVNGVGFPMRPVANLQTRTALADPGVGTLYAHLGTTTTGTGVNNWTGGSEWALKAGDLYNTAYVAYVSGTAGQRFQPAYGGLQLSPLTGYPSVQWGSLSAIGGGLPVTFDGQSVFEQGFLYVPEAVLIVVGASGMTFGPTFSAATTDAYSWIFTWEQFDAQGNFHISARSTPVTLTQVQAGGAGTYNPTFYVPTLGATCRGRFGAGTNTAFDAALSPPTYPVTLGVYRTQRNGLVYYRVNDRYFNNVDPQVPSLGAVVPNSFTGEFVTFVDGVPDLIAQPSASFAIDDGTHPILYGDGTTGAPGNLDNFCPPSSSIMVRHKERLFVARGNQVMFTKARGELAGPGYNEQVNAFFVGSDEPIIAMESMDDKLVIFKPSQLFVVAGDGPNDDGSGSSFQAPQPVPTDAGCSDPFSVRATPEGLYFMSTAGLRRLSRSLAVEYVGGPVEDDVGSFPDIRSCILYPSQNRVIWAATTNDQLAALGELIIRDYVLDAWTTAQVMDVGQNIAAAALAVGNAPSIQFSPALVPTLYLLTPSGALWRERDPMSSTAYYDHNTYVVSVWDSPLIKQQDGARFRLWDMIAYGQSVNPHGLKIQIAIDDGGILANIPTPAIWTWNSAAAGAHNIAPGGFTQTALTRIRTYDGRLGASFQVRIQDVSDAASTTGQGFQLLGLSLALGVAPGPYKLPPSATQ